MVDGYILPGRMRVFWVTTLSSVTSPTATQINAGTELTAALKGPPDTPRSGNVADDSDLASRVDKQAQGTITLGASTLMLKRTLATETAYSAVAEGASGFLVVLRKGTAGASPAADDVADVFTVDVNVKAPGTPGRNEVDFSNVELLNTDEPSYDAVLVA